MRAAGTRHTQNLKGDSRASLLVSEETGGDPLGAARITLVGDVLAVPAEEVASARAIYLERHENARYWVDFDDFAFFRMMVGNVYYIGGFGVMGWVAASDYGASEPDPLLDCAAGIIGHMNQDHGDALILLAKAAGEAGTEEARMTSVDRLGFHLRLRSGERVHGMRLAFPREVRNAEGARSALIEMVRESRRSDQRM